MYKKIISSISLVFLLSQVWQSYAIASVEAVPTTWVVDQKMIAPVYQDFKVTYEYDKSNVKVNSNTNLYEVKCDSKKLIKLLWLNNLWNSKKLKSLVYEEWNLNVNVDFNTCWVSWYKAIYDNTWNYDMITEEEALKKANEYLKLNISKYKLPLWEWIVLYKNWNNWVMYKTMDMSVSNMTEWYQVEEPIIEDDENTDNLIDNKYYSVDIVFPLLIGKIPVYDQYWNPVWVTVNVWGNWEITLFNVPFTTVKLANRKAKLIDNDTLYSIIDKWWNFPYYDYSNTSKEKTIKLENKWKVLILFNYYSNGKGKSYQFISSWIRLESNEKLPYQTKNYNQIISDYVIWNTMNYYY